MTNIPAAAHNASIGAAFARADANPIRNAAAKLPVNFTAAYYSKSRDSEMSPTALPADARGAFHLPPAAD